MAPLADESPTMHTPPPMPSATEYQQLWLERALHTVLCRYARACDERDWPAMAQVFTPDCQADYSRWHCADRDAIVDMVRQHLGGCGPTQHLLGNLQVQPLGGGWRSRTSVRAAHRGAAELKALRYDALGEYTDDWVLTPEGWRIAYRHMSMTLEIGDRSVLRSAASTGPQHPERPA